MEGQIPCKVTMKTRERDFKKNKWNDIPIYKEYYNVPKEGSISQNDWKILAKLAKIIWKSIKIISHRIKKRTQNSIWTQELKVKYITEGKSKIKGAPKNKNNK